MVKYKRIILKISGEALAGEAGFGIKPPVIAKIAQQIKEVAATSGAVKPTPRWEWNAPKPTIWGCWLR